MKRQLRAFLQAALPALLVLLPGCAKDPVKEMNAKERLRILMGENAHEAVPLAREFVALFPTQDWSVHYLEAERSPPLLVVNAYLFERYILQLSVELKCDLKTGQILDQRAPRYFLQEVTGVTSYPGGATRLEKGDIRVLGPDEWAGLTAAKGDFSAVGIEVKKAEPVPGFREFQDAQQKPRTPPP